MTEPERAPGGFNPYIPNAARMYDYYLGGKDNLAIDRKAAEKVLTAAPEVRRMALENRFFLGRVVRFLTQSGIRQFIDIGTGLPTQRNVHEIAQEIAPDARVVYVDHDPVVLAHARALLTDTANTIVIQEDLRRPGDVLGHHALRNLIDFDLPVALLFLSVLHFIPADDDPHKIVARYRGALAPDSYLVISNVVETPHSNALKNVENVYNQSKAARGGGLHTREQVLRYFDGFDLVDPGLVLIPEWRPEKAVKDPDEVWMVGGVGRKSPDRP